AAREDRSALPAERSSASGRLADARGRGRLGGAVELLTLIVGLGVAGLAKGATAMGLPLIATPILASVFGPRQAVVIISIPIVVANTLLVLQSWRVWSLLPSLLPLVAANAVGTVFGAFLLAGLDQRTFAVLIAAMAALFLLRGGRLVGDPGTRRARFLVPVVGFRSEEHTSELQSP